MLLTGDDYDVVGVTVAGVIVTVVDDVIVAIVVAYACNWRCLCCRCCTLCSLLVIIMLLVLLLLLLLFLLMSLLLLLPFLWHMLEIGNASVVAVVLYARDDYVAVGVTVAVVVFAASVANAVVVVVLYARYC